MDSFVCNKCSTNRQTSVGNLIKFIDHALFKLYIVTIVCQLEQQTVFSSTCIQVEGFLSSVHLFHSCVSVADCVIMYVIVLMPLILQLSSVVSAAVNGKTYFKLPFSSICTS